MARRASPDLLTGPSPSHQQGCLPTNRAILYLGVKVCALEHSCVMQEIGQAGHLVRFGTLATSPTAR